MKIAYCRECKPPTILAIGNLLEEVKIPKTRNHPARTVKTANYHVVKTAEGNVRHDKDIKFVTVPDDYDGMHTNTGEYMKRIFKKHKDKLK